MAFGKRAQAPAPAPQPQTAAAASRIGTASNILETIEAGARGLDARGLTSEQIAFRWQAEDEKAHAEAAALTRKFAANLAGGEIRPYYILHRRLWQGREDFLVRWLDVWPRQYCLFLPTNDVGAFILDSFRCPDFYAEEHLVIAAHHLDLMTQEHAELMKLRPSGAIQPDRQDVLEFAERLAQLRARHLSLVDKIASSIAAHHRVSWKSATAGGTSPQRA